MSDTVFASKELTDIMETPFFGHRQIETYAWEGRGRRDSLTWRHWEGCLQEEA